MLLSQAQELAAHVLRTTPESCLTLGLPVCSVTSNGWRSRFTMRGGHGGHDLQYSVRCAVDPVATIYGVIPVISSAVMLLSMMYVTALLDGCWRWVAFSVVPVLVIIPRVYDRRMRGEYIHVKELESSTLGMREVLSAIRVEGV